MSDEIVYWASPCGAWGSCKRSQLLVLPATGSLTRAVSDRNRMNGNVYYILERAAGK